MLWDIYQPLLVGSSYLESWQGSQPWLGLVFFPKGQISLTGPGNQEHGYVGSIHGE